MNLAFIHTPASVRRMSEAEALKLAAFILNQHADSMKDCHTLDGEWCTEPPHEDVLPMYRETKATARRLRAMARKKGVPRG